MLKKLTRTDIFFIVSLITGVLALSIYLFTYPYHYDETFFATVPYRLAEGDSLVQHEWHLTQFSSLFTYLPVKIWLSIKGSTEGIIVFLRCIYYLIHTAVAVTIYVAFRKHGVWAVAAAMIFFTQASYRIFSMSYNSMFVIFTLLCTLTLLSIYKNSSKHLYVIAGACFAFSCVCNPLYCFAFPLYLIFCMLWTKRNLFKAIVIKIKSFFIPRVKKTTDKNQTNNIDEIDAFPHIESYNCFFTKEAVIYFFLGISAVAAISVIFFFATGGTVNSVFDNVQNLLNNSEYMVTSHSLLTKIKSTLNFFDNISFNKSYILPLFFILLIAGVRRKGIWKRCVFLTVSLVISIVYMFGIFYLFSFYTFCFSLPFIIFSTTCYILTEKRNTRLFFCIWIPAIVAAIFQYFASNTMLTSLGLVLAIVNIPGVIFVKDLFNEIKVEQKVKTKAKTKRQRTQSKGAITFVRGILVTGICAQLIFHGFALQYEQIPYNEETVRATYGPHSGIIMTEKQHQSYTNVLSDFDFINSINTDKVPLLVVSCKNWIYLYNESPMATNTAWTDDTINKEPLISYYKENPEKIPGYIYVDTSDYYDAYNEKTIQRNMETMSEMFEFTREELSHGFLLTVEKYKF